MHAFLLITPHINTRNLIQNENKHMISPVNPAKTFRISRLDRNSR